MLSTRIAAGVAAVVLGISGVALANVGASGDSQTDISTPSASAGVTTETETSLAASPSTTTHEGSTTSVTSATTSATTSVTSGTTPTTVDSTSTTVDDNPGTDDSDEQETRSVVSLNLSTYAVGEAGTVTVDGMVLVAVDANPGWTVEIEEASADKIKVEFENGERDVEFELRVDGELRIKTGS